MNIALPSPLLTLNKARVNQVIFLLLSFYLIVDMANGFFRLGLGVDVKLSVVYKSCILILILISWLSRHVLNIVWATSLVLMLLMSESLNLFTLQASGSMFGFVVQHIVKLFTPFLTFFWLTQLIREDSTYLRSVHWVIHINFYVFIANICLGLSGFGFSTYGGNVDEDSIGVKGFFYAGNEISMLWVVFSAYYLNRIYQQQSKFAYVAFAIFAIFVGLMISTKTAILATFLLFIGIPIILERSNLFNLTKGISYFFFLTCVLAIVAGILVYQFILESNLYDRFDFIFRKHGILGIILSGRNIFLMDLNEMLFSVDSVFRILFGMGVSFYADHIKYSAELDFPDIFFWHGLVGVLIIFSLFMRMSWHALTHCFSPYFPNAGSVVLTNIILFFIANLSGHVFTSGMLGVLWAFFCASAYLRVNDAYTHN